MEHWLGEKATTPAGRAWDAVCDADYKALDKVIGQHGDAATLEVQGPIGHPVTALTAAAQRGDTQALTMLLENDADPNVRASGNMIASPMAWAIEAQSLGCVRMLLTSDRYPLVLSPPDEDWAELAVLRGDYIKEPRPAILKALLDAGIGASAEALGRAVDQGIHQVAKLLLDSGADANGPNARTGLLPMAHTLSLPGRVEAADTIGPQMMRLLIDKGASVDALCGPPGMHRPMALVAAIERGQPWAVRCLLDAGADAEGARAHIRQYGVRTNTPYDRTGAGIAEALALLV